MSHSYCYNTNNCNAGKCLHTRLHLSDAFLVFLKYLKLLETSPAYEIFSIVFDFVKAFV